MAAREMGVVIIPVLNKIDMSAARVEDVTMQLVEVLDFDPDDVLQVG